MFNIQIKDFHSRLEKNTDALKNKLLASREVQLFKLIRFWIRTSSAMVSSKGLRQTRHTHRIRIIILEVPGWLSLLRVWLWLQSWSHDSWVKTLHQGLCCQNQACRSSVSLTLPLLHSFSRSLSLKYKHWKKFLKKIIILDNKNQFDGETFSVNTICLYFCTNVILVY